MSVTVTTSDEGNDFDLYLFDPEGHFAGSSTSSGTPPGGEAFGRAPFLADLAGRRLNAPVVGFAASP